MKTRKATVLSALKEANNEGIDFYDAGHAMKMPH